MNALSLAAAGLRGHARRLGATALAIVLSVAFVATTMLALDAMERGVGEAVAGDLVDRDLVLWSGEEPVGFDDLDQLRALEGVSVLGVTAEAYGASGNNGAMAVTAPRGPDVVLVEGALPAAPGQVAVTPDSGLAVGDSVAFERFLDDGTDAPVADLDVVGVLDVGNAPQYTWQDVLVVDETQLRAWDPDLVLTMVSMDLAGLGEGDARQQITEIAPGARLQTGPEAARDLVSSATGGLDMLGPVLLGFGAIAVATSALVIANTFAIVLAQRTRELALLRCVGATRSQVRRTVLVEALTLGVLAATAGVLIGVAVTWGAALSLGEINLGSPVTLRPGWDPVSLLVPWVVGIAVTVLAAWWPIRRATRVAPVAALQPSATPAMASRPGLVRVISSVLLLGTGGALLVLGSTAAGSGDGSVGILVGVLGGLVSFVGVLVAAVFCVPAGIRALGAALRGVPSRLAVGNAASNPGRAAATSAALLIGVTLITMTSVGAASAARTADAEIDAQFPADVMVQPSFEPDDDGVYRATPLGGATVGQIGALDGVAETVSVPAGWLEISVGDDSWWTETPVYGVDAQRAATVLRDADVLESLEPGTIGLSADQLYYSNLAPGDLVRATGPQGEAELTVVEAAVGEFVMRADELASLDASSQDGGGLLIRLTEDADVSSTVADIREATGDTEHWVTGGAAMRAELNSVLDLLVVITTALLGVAVVIAVVGIANTLALSVLERGRENALLRALGLTRSQLRGMLTVEGVLLAVVSAVLGIALGVTYAWFGVRTVMPDGTDLVLALPVVRLSVILLVAVAAGLLAAVLPARRAARITPAAGLATIG